MKIRTDFVTNSSSTSFIITNKSKRVRDLADFVRENPQLIDEYITEYDWDKDNMCQCRLEASAKARGMKLQPGENVCNFGDEEGDLVGKVFDYILRSGGESKSFKWCFKEWLR